MRRKPKRGTKPALRMGAHRSRIRLASAQMALISLIFVTPMATSSSGLLGKLPNLIAPQKIEKDRPCPSVGFSRSGGCWRTPVSLELHQRRKRFAERQRHSTKEVDGRIKSGHDVSD